jgi:pyruvate kinase
MGLGRVKIVATLGPASADPRTLERLVRGSADVLRLNFSHGDFASHGESIALVRSLEERIGRPLAVLQDLPGPKLRLAELPAGTLTLRPGQEVTFGDRGSTATLPLETPGIAGLLEPGDRVLLSDGALELEVLGAADGLLRCSVLIGGAVSSRKGVNVPSRRWTPEVPTAADREAVLFGLARGVDLVALSYVGAAAEILATRALIASAGCDVPVVAKIETRRALDHLEEIVEAADGVMVARGDLGVEIPPEEVPTAQRRILAAARRSGRPAIVATQMLGSMTASPRPSRAETSDVAGAVWGGADAVMLSEETAAGAYPIEAVETMARIVAATASEPDYCGAPAAVRSPADAVADAACRLAADIGAAAIVAATESGSTAAAVSRFRPACPIVGLTPSRATARRLCLLWGVASILEEPYTDLGDMAAKAARAARTLGVARPGDRLVCTAGFPAARSGGTDLVRVIGA